jgi:hypothetical protein
MTHDVTPDGYTLPGGPPSVGVVSNTAYSCHIIPDTPVSEDTTGIQPRPKAERLDFKIRERQ